MSSFKEACKIARRKSHEDREAIYYVVNGFEEPYEVVSSRLLLPKDEIVATFSKGHKAKHSSQLKGR